MINISDKEEEVEDIKEYVKELDDMTDRLEKYLRLKREDETKRRIEEEAMRERYNFEKNKNKNTNQGNSPHKITRLTEPKQYHDPVIPVQAAYCNTYWV